MTERKIVTIGDPVLRERARDVNSDELRSSEIQRLIDDLIEAKRAAHGAGIVPGMRGVVNRSVSIRIRYLDRDGNEHDEVKRGLTAGTFQHEVDHLDGTLFVDRADPRTLMSWEHFERLHRDEFVARMTELVERVGS